MIRKALISDLHKIVELYQDANPDVHSSKIKKWTQKSLKDFSEYNWVQDNEPGIVGSISGIVDTFGSGIINDIAVLKNHRGTGIGSQLLTHLMDIYKDNHIRHVKLCVFWKNAAVIPFYYKFGFVLFSTGKELGYDVIYLEKMI